MTARYRAFPPGRGHLKIPLASRRSARAGLAMYAPCRPKGRFVRWAAWRMVGLLGPRALPGLPTEWEPPMPDAVWSALGEEWVAAAGRFDGVAVYQRLQASRSGLALMLLRDGDPVAFVKVREGDQKPIENESRALDAVSSHGLKAFVVPRPLTIGEVEGWHYLMTSVLAPELHRMPTDPPLERVLEDIRVGLSLLERPPGTPAHWEPMHGDFTPWNLRERGDGSLVLIDWEDAGWAPPGADEAYYWATLAALQSGEREHLPISVEACLFWGRILDGRLERSRAAGDPDSVHAETVRLLLRSD